MTSEFSHKRMDEEEAWRCNYEYMKAHYPSIAGKAFGFYLQKVIILIHTIPVKEREIYKKEYAVDNLIILNTTFNTESTIGDIPFDINSEYKDYPWIMVKNEEGKWVVRSWGY